MKTKCRIVCVVSICIGVALSGCNSENQQQQTQSTISVFGIGTVLTQPDMVQMNISLSNVAQTTRQAQEAVNNMVRQALQILKDSAIEDKNISTASLRFNPEYEWGNTRRIVIGQKAEQIIAFSINDINDNAEKVSKIIDQLIQIDGIELNQMNFSVKDNKELFIKSRELAYQKAVEKANQYAELSGLKIIKTLCISEEGNSPILPQNIMFSNQLTSSAGGEMADASGSTVLPTGELEITTKILVAFLLE
jgi:uncharacterized protein YggE